MKVILMTAEEVESLIQKVSSATLEAFKEQMNLDPDGKPEEAGEYIDKRKAAKILNCSTGTVDNLAREGRLKRSYVGKSVRFSRAEVMAIFARKRGN